MQDTSAKLTNLSAENSSGDDPGICICITFNMPDTKLADLRMKQLQIDLQLSEKTITELNSKLSKEQEKDKERRQMIQQLQEQLEK